MVSRIHAKQANFHLAVRALRIRRFILKASSDFVIDCRVMDCRVMDCRCGTLE